MTRRLSSQTSGSISATYPPPVSAALLCITSSPPKRSTAKATAASRSASEPPSACRYAAAGPSARATPSPASSFTSAMTTRAPSATKRRAVAAPMPEAPPVTMATLPSSLPMRSPCHEGRTHVNKRSFAYPRLRPLLRDPRRRPVARAERARRVPSGDRPGRARRAGRLLALLDRRAPLPLRVLALLRARGALRRGRGAHEDDPHRPRRPSPALPLQPPDPRRRDGGPARLRVRRAPRVRHRALRDARRARRLRHRPPRDVRHVGGGPRGDRRRVDHRRLLLGGHALPRPAAARAAEAAPEAAPAAVDGLDQPREPRDRGPEGPRPPLLHDRRAARGAGGPHRALPKRPEGGAARREVRERPRRHLHHGPLRGDRRGGAPERRRVRPVVPPPEHRADRLARRLAGGARARQLRVHARAGRAELERCHLRAARRHGRRPRRRPRDLHPEGQALPRGGL